MLRIRRAKPGAQSTQQLAALSKPQAVAATCAVTPREPASGAEAGTTVTPRSSAESGKPLRVRRHTTVLD